MPAASPCKKTSARQQEVKKTTRRLICCAVEAPAQIQVSSCSNPHVVVTPSTGRVVRGGWLRRASPIAAKPPPLIAVVLPWNRGSDGMAARRGERERRMKEKVQMATNGPKFPDPRPGDNGQQRVGFGWSTMETAIGNEKSEHGEKVIRVTIMRRGTNEDVH
ncbi:hypothetical protein PIB30_049939 [Stylosanthes scabra]|uniref:Uncharacterized protein n=1 Tax=Stylosanthes scabra TaxID=79078 RepID=A0ABU6SHX8_9FABA|nr:hypothetical protein [Stylosanthes scabra]